MNPIDIGFKKEVITGPDTIIIRSYVDGIKGGVVLDMAGFTPEILKAGHPIIKSNGGVYKPMPLNNDATSYGSLPANHTYVGVNVHSKEWKKEGSFVAVMTIGELNDVAAPYDFSTIAAAFKAAVPTIVLDHD